jgi:hypothetical protein
VPGHHPRFFLGNGVSHVDSPDSHLVCNWDISVAKSI